MFLFIHGTGATSSLWLPQIRGLLGLGKNFSDKDILDTFAISLPGHPKNDQKFDEKYVFQLIEKFVESKADKQADLAQKLVLTHQPEIIAGLKTKKLILIGHDVGAALALQYGLFYPQNVEKIISVACGDKFNPLVLKLNRLFYKLIFRLDLKIIRNIQNWRLNRREKVKFSIFAENPDRKGFWSCIEIAERYDFVKQFDKLSLESQLKFIKIPILLIIGQFDLLARPASALRLQTVLDPSSNLLKTKKTIIETKRSQLLETVRVQIYPWTQHQVLDGNLLDFVQDSRDFISHK
jgi:pimeloyl-ACP methyl ester carboxylesterase